MSTWNLEFVKDGDFFQRTIIEGYCLLCKDLKLFSLPEFSGELEILFLSNQITACNFCYVHVVKH
jgi:hypothetical protein